jgi:hypothetical protein
MGSFLVGPLTNHLLMCIYSLRNKTDKVGRRQRVNSTQKFKLLGNVSRYDLYYSLIYTSSSESPLGLKLVQIHITLCLIFIK